MDLVTGENLPDAFSHNFAKYIQRRADVDPAGVFDVVVHGSFDFVLLGGSPAPASYLARVIRSQPEYTEGQKVRLLSCLLGTNGDKSFAQALANELGVDVQAANGLVRVTDTGIWDVVGYQIRRGRLIPKENVLGEMIWFPPVGGP